jgi:hypothetical protein
MLPPFTSSLPTQFFNRIHGAWLALLLVSLMLVAYSIFSSYISPRPYYVQNLGFDIENDYVYSSRLIVATGTPHHILHPGTPVQYLGAGIMAVTGADIERTQTFLNAGYAITLLAIIGSLAIFTKIALSKTSFAVAFLALGGLIMWPPLLTFMNYWGGEVFIYCVGLVATAMIWPAIDKNRQLSRKENIVLGLVIGFGLAVKISFVPIALILVVTVTAIGIKNRLFANIHNGGWRSSSYKLFREPILIGGSAAVMFALATSPVLLRFHQLFAVLYRKWRIDPVLGTADSITKFSTDLIGAAPLTVSIVGIVSILITAGLVHSIIRDRNFTRNGESAADQPSFSRTGAGVLVISVLFVGGAYGISSASAVGSVDGKDPGILIRELTGIMAVIPILVLCTHRVLAPIIQNTQRVRINRTLISAALVTIGMGAILITMISYGSWRAKDIDNREHKIAALQAKLTALGADDTQIVLGETEITGAPYFHYYGDSIYAAGYFKDQLSADFDRYGFIRWSQLRRYRLAAIGLEPADPDVIRNTGILGIAERMYQNWRAVWPDREPTHDVLTGNDDSLPVSVFAYSDAIARSGRLGNTQLEIYNTIEDIFGEILYWDTLELEDGSWNFAMFRVPGQ